MIISIEGIDGAGKNTLVTALKSYFDSSVSEISLEVLSFPRYETSIQAAAAAAALKGDNPEVLNSPYAMASIFALDRLAVRAQLCAAAADPQKLVLLDRYVASNAAYSMARVGQENAPHGEISQWIYDLEFTKFQLPIPALQVFLATPPNTAAIRAAQRESQDNSRYRDSYERDFSLQNRTFSAYQNLAQANWAGKWLVTSDASQIIASWEQLQAGNLSP
ncbi:dTMP kinase [Corynebacterium caspium]|uniref:dTMP kinase n=1 Tax=Corynebacterium caspium TaxID=234828 RepID=UPI000368B399|nr:dTMP kinase [Corynebacterium caspium]WKD59715.1 Thymidylate kinase [Corynebacterium caspium DSM 44850]